MRVDTIMIAEKAVANRPFTDPARAAVCPQQAPVNDSNRCSCRWSQQRSLWGLESRNDALPEILLDKVAGRC